MEFFITALSIGLLGSFHCVGMCGPIALALPVHTPSPWKYFLSRILYNLGRVATYMWLGALMGFVGQRVMLAGVQQNLSILIGVLILLGVVLPKKITSRLENFSLLGKMYSVVRSGISNLFQQRTLGSLFIIGMVNGLLPCGFVYVALAGAATTGDALRGATFLLGFGLGTIPLMFAVSYYGKMITLNVRAKISKLIPLFTVLLALLFILRGLNLGIPYVSPKLDTGKVQQDVMCH